MLPVYFRDPATGKLAMIEVDTDDLRTAHRTVTEHLGPDHKGAVMAFWRQAEPAPEFLEPGAGI